MLAVVGSICDCQDARATGNAGDGRGWQGSASISKRWQDSQGVGRHREESEGVTRCWGTVEGVSALVPAMLLATLMFCLCMNHVQTITKRSY